MGSFFGCGNRVNTILELIYQRERQTDRDTRMDSKVDNEAIRPQFVAPFHHQLQREGSRLCRVKAPK